MLTRLEPLPDVSAFFQSSSDPLIENCDKSTSFNIAASFFCFSMNSSAPSAYNLNIIFTHTVSKYMCMCYLFLKEISFLIS